MDPDAAYQEWASAVRSGDREDALMSWADLKDWIDRGGFEPNWTRKERAYFMRWRPSRPSYYADTNGGENPMHRRFRKKNPMTSTEDLLLAGGALAVLSIVGYAVYAKTRAASTAAAANPFINASQSPQAQVYASGVNAGLTAAAPPPGSLFGQTIAPGWGTGGSGAPAGLAPGYQGQPAPSSYATSSTTSPGDSYSPFG